MKEMKIFAGMIELMRPLNGFTRSEREHLADVLSGIAADIKKFACDPTSIRFMIEIEPDDAR